MRARTITIVIGVATAAVMAPGAQTATALPTHGTALTIYGDGGGVYGDVDSQRKKCERRRRVVLFKQRPGADRRLASTRSEPHDHATLDRRFGYHWEVWYRRIERLQPGELQPDDVVYAKVRPKRRPGFMCRSDRSNRVVVWEGCSSCGKAESQWGRLNPNG